MCEFKNQFSKVGVDAWFFKIQMMKNPVFNIFSKQ